MTLLVISQVISLTNFLVNSYEDEIVFRIPEYLFTFLRKIFILYMNYNVRGIIYTYIYLIKNRKYLNNLISCTRHKYHNTSQYVTSLYLSLLRLEENVFDGCTKIDTH